MKVGNNPSPMGIKIPRIYLRYSIWISAATIVVLIALLGLTIYSVRERAIVDLFSTQQTLIAQRTASRTEETIRRCERGMQGLSRVVNGNQVTFVEMNAMAGPYNYNTRTVTNRGGIQYVYAP